jgi:hypothetical protein
VIGSEWFWAITTALAQNIAIVCWPTRYTNGLASKLWRRIIRWPRTPFWLRVAQITVVFAIAKPLPGHLGVAVYYGGVLVLVLDDFLFGDDQDWRKRWEGVRNRIRWRMKLPQPAAEPGTA